VDDAVQGGNAPIKKACVEWVEDGERNEIQSIYLLWVGGGEGKLQKEKKHRKESHSEKAKLTCFEKI